MTKIEISPADIRKGDLIRVELNEGARPHYDLINIGPTAFEYEAVFDGHGVKLAYSKHSRVFLLERPEQPFKVGTVVQGTGQPDENNLWVRGGKSWVTIPRGAHKTFTPYESNLTDPTIRKCLDRGDLKILSEPA